MLSDQQWKRIDEPPDRSRINGLQGERWFCTEQEASLPVGEKRRRAPPASSALCRGRCRSDDSRGRLLWTTTVSPSLLRCNSPIKKEERLTIDANTGRPMRPSGAMPPPLQPPPDSGHREAETKQYLPSDIDKCRKLVSSKI